MHLIVSLQTSDDAAQPAPTLLVNNQAVDAATVQRSSLLQNLLGSAENSSCDIQLDFDAFCAWRDFDSLLHSTPEDLVRLLQASHFLQDDASLEHASSALASQLRALLRTSLTPARLLKLPLVCFHQTPADRDAIGHVAEAMAPLNPGQLSSVLQRLHPFEIFQLPDSLRATAFAPSSDSAAPMDLTPPIYHIDIKRSTPFAINTLSNLRLEATIESFLRQLTTPAPLRPAVSSLLLTSISQASAALLHHLFSPPNPPTSLQMLLPEQHCHLPFLHTATSLTRLHLGTGEEFRESLLDPLSHLSQLHDLSLCLSDLPDADKQLLGNLPGQHSPLPPTRVTRKRQWVFPLVTALQNVRRVRLIPRDDNYSHLITSDWPDLFCRALPPLATLEHLTVAGVLKSTIKLLGSSSPASPHRLKALKVPARISACGFRNTGDQEIVRSRFHLGKLCAALAWVNTLRELELDCRSSRDPQFSSLSQLTALEALRLVVVRPLHEEKFGFLASLVNLCSLELSVAPARGLPGGRISPSPRCDLSGSVVSLPLTRLCLWRSRVMDPESLAMFGQMRALLDLTLRIPEGCYQAKIDAVQQAAFESMLGSLTRLTALDVPMLLEAEAMGGVLRGLLSLQKLELHVLRQFERKPWLGDSGGAESEAAGELCTEPEGSEGMKGRRGTLESLHIRAWTIRSAVWYMQRLGLALGRVTSLKVDSEGSGAAEAIEGLGSLLKCMPDLETLHLPGTEWGEEGFGVLVEHIGRLTKLDELALWRPGMPPVGFLWEHLRKLPLRRGFHGFRVCLED